MDVDAQDIHFPEQGWLHLPGVLARHDVVTLLAWSRGGSVDIDGEGLPVLEMAGRAPSL